MKWTYINNGKLFVLILQLSLFGIIANSCGSLATNNFPKNRIVVEAEFRKSFFFQLNDIFEIKDKLDLSISPLNYISYKQPVEYISAPVVNGKIKWEYYSDTPILVAPPFGTPIILNPGDKLHILYSNDMPRYTGNDITSLALIDTLMEIDEQTDKPTKKNASYVTSVDDYLGWNQYLDKKLALQLPVIESYRDKISTEEYYYYKAHFIEGIENDRVMAFSALAGTSRHSNIGISNINLTQLWDSTQYKPSRLWLQSLPADYGTINQFYYFMTMEAYRKYQFNLKNDSLKSPAIKTVLLYTNAKQNYKGLTRERLLAYILDDRTSVGKRSENGVKELLLKDYYSQPGFPEYKQWVKSLEKSKKLVKN